MCKVTCKWAQQTSLGLFTHFGLGSRKNAASTKYKNSDLITWEREFRKRFKAKVEFLSVNNCFSTRWSHRYVFGNQFGLYVKL